MSQVCSMGMWHQKLHDLHWAVGVAALPRLVGAFRVAWCCRERCSFRDPLEFSINCTGFGEKAVSPVTDEFGVPESGASSLGTRLPVWMVLCACSSCFWLSPRVTISVWVLFSSRVMRFARWAIYLKINEHCSKVSIFVSSIKASGFGAHLASLTNF